MRRGLNRMAGALAAVAMCVSLGACGTPAPQEAPKDNAPAQSTNTTDDTTQTEKPIGVSINLSDDSILTFDGDAASAQLVQDMTEGKTPKSCDVLYDQMGSLPSVTVTDARTMRDIYKKLAHIQVEGTTDKSVTDSYHHVSFELQDGTKVSFGFEGEDVLVRGQQNYAVSDAGGLWTYVQSLQKKQLRDESAGDDWLAIKLDDTEELVLDCPTSAPAGETVQVIVPILLDVDMHVAINENEGYGSYVDAETYEFVMPNEPVTVRVWTDNQFTSGS